MTLNERVASADENPLVAGQVQRRGVRHRLRSDDAGVAMVMVIGVFTVIMIMSIALVATVVFGVSFTQASKQGVKAQAAADGALDVMQSRLYDKTYQDLTDPALASLICSPIVTIDNIDVKVTTKYSVKPASSPSKVDKACPSAGDTVVGLTVTADAVTKVAVVDETERRTRLELLAIVPPAALDKALFGESTFTMYNDFKLYQSSGGTNDANVYSNGGLDCKTQNPIQGKITAAQGDLILSNTCIVYSSVWASGKVQLSSQGRVFGDVYAASTADDAVTFGNSSNHVSGSILTNGGVNVQGVTTNPLSSRGGVGGSVYSSQKGLSVSSGDGTVIDGSVYVATKATLARDRVRVGGSVFAKGEVSLSNGWGNASDVKVAGTVQAPTVPAVSAFGNPKPAAVTTGAVTTAPGSFPATITFAPGVGYPSTIVAPPREQMPKVTMTADDILTWQASGWDVVTETSCTSPGAGAALKNRANAATADTLVIFNCPAGVPVTFGTDPNLTLTHGLGVVSATGIKQENSTFTVSGAGGTPQKFYWIVPADSAHVAWNPVPGVSGQTTPVCSSPAPNITINKVKPSNTLWMMYTPCQVSWQNGLDGSGSVFEGQIYAGGLSMGNGFPLKMASVGVPTLTSGTVSPTDKVDLRLQSWYDLSGH